MVFEFPIRQGALEVVASHFDDTELNSRNDIVANSDGFIYFTDPTYGRIREDLSLLRKQELGFQGVYRVSADGGDSSPAGRDPARRVSNIKSAGELPP